MTTDTDRASRELADLIDKQRIHENLMLYCRGQDRKDLELMKASYWPDATDNHGSFVGNAHDFCELSVQGQKASGHAALHYCTNVLIELDGGQAKRESAFLYTMIGPRGRDVTQFLGGRYKDLCEKRGDEWRVLRRVCVFDWANEIEGGRDFAGLFNFPPTTVTGALHPDDPIYAAW